MAGPEVDEEEAAFERRRRRAGTRPVAKSKPKGKAGLVFGWLLLLLVIGGLVGGGWFYKSRVVALLPVTAKLYDLAGIAVEVPYPGFVVVPGVKTTAQEVDGRKIWLIDGEVRNVGVRPRPSPKLVARVMKDDQPLKSWTFEIGGGDVEPGETVPFETSVEELPGATRLSVDFIDEPAINN